MASANPLEDEISCSICFEVYRNPHLLRECLHTFCYECIQRLIQRGRVECPECRDITQTKDIKKDFKTQRLIDVYISQQEDSGREKHLSGIRCGMCQENKPIKSQCVDCENYMCGACEKIHLNLKHFKSHKVMQMKEIVKGYELTLKNDITDMEREKQNATKKIIIFDQSMMNIEIARKKQLSDVKLYTKNAIKELNENQIHLEKVINDANDNLIAHLAEGKKVCAKTVQDIQSNIEIVNGMLQRQDINTLIETANSVDLTIREDILRIKANLPNMDSIKTESTVTVKRERKWEAKSCINVEVADCSLKTTHEDVLTETGYTHFYKVKLKQNHKESLNYEPYKLCKANGQLWCAGSASVYVYNTDCTFLKQISHEKIQSAQTLTACESGDIIVSCFYDNGLHQLDSNGKYLTQVAVGSFTDTCYHQGRLYALEHKDCTIKVFKFTDKWMHVKDIKLQYSNGSNCDRLCVHNNGIHVSSYFNECVYRYTKDGSFQESITKLGTQGSPGKFQNPYLCDVDHKGNVIVSDWKNNNLQMCDKEGNWHMITLPGLEKNDYIYSLLKENENVWITTDAWKLIKYLVQ